MFPARVADARLAPKAQVFVLRAGDYRKAWLLDDFDGGRVINDRVGDLDVVLVGDAASRSVRAYAAVGHACTAAAEPRQIACDGELWAVQEEALVAPSGQRLLRLPGHIAYWFAGSGFLAGLPLYDDETGAGGR